LPGYEGCWELRQEAIKQKLLYPQFHGREHLNLRVFEEKLFKKDHEVITAIKNRSYTSISNSGYKTISITGAFEFWDFKENERFKMIINDGLNAFEKVFGYRARHFNPPGGSEHPVLHKTLYENGIEFIDAPRFNMVHQGQNKHKFSYCHMGKTNMFGQVFMVKNCVFEPTDNRGVSWVSYTLKQIEIAFKWNKPANISSHRVNFSGHISSNNRSIGINSLKILLREIVKRWPEVEFMSSLELMKIIKGDV
jgi:hypothetical protein